jgi:voltage-gated potassium channel
VKTKHRIYEIMERAEQGDQTSRVFDLFIVSLISLNVVMVIVETVDAIAVPYGRFFQVFESFSVVVFTLEYVMRLWSCTADPEFRSALLGRFRFATTGFSLIDFLAIAPFYLQLFVSLDPSLVGAVRLLRLFRLFKMGRYIRSIRLLGAVLRDKRQEMYLVVTVLTIVLIMISSLMFYVEHEAQPDAFSSIPASMWWGMVTLTTVGYGDVFPITMLGKFFGILIAMLGIGMFALPAGILSSGFVEAIAHDGDSSVEGSEEVVAQFVSAINDRNLDRLMSLTTESHRLVLPDAHEVVGQERVFGYWQRQTESPQGAILIRTMMSKDDRVLVTGSITGVTDTPIPGAWEARIEEGLIAEWRKFSVSASQ